MKRFRAKSAVRVADFVRKFPWKGFLIQAPQVTADIWGVGVQLGGIMGLLAEATYGAVRALAGQSVVVRGPPPSDAVGKALNYLSGAGWQYSGAGWLSVEDHWLLLAADVVATTIVMDQFSADQFSARIDGFIDQPFLYQEPWHPATRQMLFEQGWGANGSYHPPYFGMGPQSTFRDVIGVEAERFPSFLSEAREDFPASTSSTMFQFAAAELAERLLSWGTGSEEIGKDVFDPEEYSLARMFETGVFPPSEEAGELVERFIERALGIARAGGRSLPGFAELSMAANEVWGDLFAA